MSVMVVCLLILTGATPEEIRQKVDDASRRRSDVLEVAKKVLIDAMDEKLKEAAVNDRLDDVKLIVVERESLVKHGIIPKSQILDDATQKYIEFRKKASSELLDVYRTTIDECEKSENRPLAVKLKIEMNKFVDTEKAALAGVQPTPPKLIEVKTTKEKIDDFFDKLKRATEDILAQPTTAKQQDALKSAERQLDDRIKSQSWTFRCRITDIREGSRGTPTAAATYSLTFQPAEELRNIPTGWRSRTGASITLSRQEALNVAPGDTLIVTGSPRFVWDKYLQHESSAFFYCPRYNDGFLADDRRTILDGTAPTVTLLNVKMNIEPAKK